MFFLPFPQLPFLPAWKPHAPPPPPLFHLHIHERELRGEERRPTSPVLSPTLVINIITQRHLSPSCAQPKFQLLRLGRRSARRKGPVCLQSCTWLPTRRVRRQQAILRRRASQSGQFVCETRWAGGGGKTETPDWVSASHRKSAPEIDIFGRKGRVSMSRDKRRAAKSKAIISLFGCSPDTISDYKKNIACPLASPPTPSWLLISLTDKPLPCSLVQAVSSRWHC